MRLSNSSSTFWRILSLIFIFVLFWCVAESAFADIACSEILDTEMKESLGGSSGYQLRRDSQGRSYCEGLYKTHHNANSSTKFIVERYTDGESTRTSVGNGPLSVFGNGRTEVDGARISIAFPDGDYQFDIEHQALEAFEWDTSRIAAKLDLELSSAEIYGFGSLSGVTFFYPALLRNSNDDQSPGSAHIRLRYPGIARSITAFRGTISDEKVESMDCFAAEEKQLNRWDSVTESSQLVIKGDLLLDTEDKFCLLFVLDLSESAGNIQLEKQWLAFIAGRKSDE